jgi:hypothetical protein
MFCYKIDDEYRHFGCREYVKAHYLKYPIVEVEVSIDENGTYWGWFDNEDNTLHGCYIWIHPSLTEMCFPYGTKVEEERGRGKKVKLSVVEISS